LFVYNQAGGDHAVGMWQSAGLLALTDALFSTGDWKVCRERNGWLAGRHCRTAGLCQCLASVFIRGSARFSG
jgi:hypothetical protein